VTLTCSLELLEKRLLKARSLGPRLAVCLVDNSTISDVVTAIGMRMTCLPPPSPKVDSSKQNHSLVKYFWLLNVVVNLGLLDGREKYETEH